MTIRTAVAAPLMLLAACGNEPAASPPPAANVSGESGYIARVRALPPGQLRGVIFRAIRDGANACPALTSFAPAPDQNGRPAWDAICSDSGRWRVVLADDGTATVTGSGPRTS